MDLGGSAWLATLPLLLLTAPFPYPIPPVFSLHLAYVPPTGPSVQGHVPPLSQCWSHGGSSHLFEGSAGGRELWYLAPVPSLERWLAVGRRGLGLGGGAVGLGAPWTLSAHLRSPGFLLVICLAESCLRINHPWGGGSSLSSPPRVVRLGVCAHKAPLHGALHHPKCRPVVSSTCLALWAPWCHSMSTRGVKCAEGKRGVCWRSGGLSRNAEEEEGRKEGRKGTWEVTLVAY